MADVEPKNVAQFIDHDELINYLPHKGKMFLLSRVTQHDVEKHTITSEYDITKDCIFYEEEFDGVPTWAGFELLLREFRHSQELQIKSKDERLFLE